MNFLFNLLSSVANSSGQQQVGCKSGDAIIWIIPLGLLVVFWIMQGRQRKKQQEEVQKKMEALKVGDVVKITFGEKTLSLRVLGVKDHVPKGDASSLYQIIED